MLFSCNKMESDPDVIFVFDESSKQSACCLVTEKEKNMYPNQIFNGSQCIIVYPDLTECKRIIKKTEENDTER